jgi:hypothetical protein
MAESEPNVIEPKQGEMLVSHPALSGVGSVGLPARSSLKTHHLTPSRHLEKTSTPRSELGLRVSIT